nr:MAG TPA: hypothetical protein [Caudoviricetes sp.]
MIGSRTFIATMSKNAFVGIRDSNPVRNAFLHQPNAFSLCPLYVIYRIKRFVCC